MFRRRPCGPGHVPGHAGRGGPEEPKHLAKAAVSSRRHSVARHRPGRPFRDAFDRSRRPTSRTPWWWRPGSCGHRQGAHHPPAQDRTDRPSSLAARCVRVCGAKVHTSPGACGGAPGRCQIRLSCWQHTIQSLRHRPASCSGNGFAGPLSGGIPGCAALAGAGSGWRARRQLALARPRDTGNGARQKEGDTAPQTKRVHSLDSGRIRQRPAKLKGPMRVVALWPSIRSRRSASTSSSSSSSSDSSTSD